jgi:cytochrome c oxidase subunit II
MNSPTAADMPMSYLQAFGLKASQVLPLTWGLLLISLAVIAVVSVLLVRGLFRSPKTTVDGPDSAPVERPVAGTSWITIGVGISAFVLFLSAVWTMATLAQIGRPPQEPAFTVEVIGHQWWWEIRYLSDQPARNFTTANEIHIPVGETVAVKLISRDVIHSFWVPALGGKTDLIPGQTNVTWMEADKPGVYRGQCAEYCGLQHAHMALTVVAQEPEAFEAWRAAQLEPAPEANTERVQAGLTAFIHKCGICHTVRGTRAQGIVGPDLSHLMERRTLAAGTLPNTPGNLAGWIADPQHVKPGNFMPQPELSAAELLSILAFLKTLE